MGQWHTDFHFQTGRSDNESDDFHYPPRYGLSQNFVAWVVEIIQPGLLSKIGLAMQECHLYFVADEHGNT